MENNIPQIPTAKEFYKKKSKELNSDPEDMPGWMIDAAREFAALHVDAALNNVAQPAGEFGYHTMKQMESIANSYPKENIK